MGAVLAGLGGPVWGTTDETNFIVENIEEVADCEEEILVDGDGDPVAASYYGRKSQLTMDFTIKVPASAPAPADALHGRSFSISDTNFAGWYIVTSITRARKKNGYMTGALTCRRFPGSFTTSTTTFA